MKFKLKSLFSLTLLALLVFEPASVLAGKEENEIVTSKEQAKIFKKMSEDWKNFSKEILPNYFRENDKHKKALKNLSSNFQTLYKNENLKDLVDFLDENQKIVKNVIKEIKKLKKKEKEPFVKEGQKALEAGIKALEDYAKLAEEGSEDFSSVALDLAVFENFSLIIKKIKKDKEIFDQAKILGNVLINLAKEYRKFSKNNLPSFYQNFEESKKILLGFEESNKYLNNIKNLADLTSLLNDSLQIVIKALHSIKQTSDTQLKSQFVKQGQEALEIAANMIERHAKIAKKGSMDFSPVSFESSVKENIDSPLEKIIDSTRGSQSLASTLFQLSQMFGEALTYKGSEEKVQLFEEIKSLIITQNKDAIIKLKEENKENYVKTYMILVNYFSEKVMQDSLKALPQFLENLKKNYLRLFPDKKEAFEEECKNFQTNLENIQKVIDLVPENNPENKNGKMTPRILGAGLKGFEEITLQCKTWSEEITGKINPTNKYKDIQEIEKLKEVLAFNEIPYSLTTSRKFISPLRQLADQFAKTSDEKETIYLNAKVKELTEGFKESYKTFYPLEFQTVEKKLESFDSLKNSVKAKLLKGWGDNLAKSSIFTMWIKTALTFKTNDEELKDRNTAKFLGFKLKELRKKMKTWVKNVKKVMDTEKDEVLRDEILLDIFMSPAYANFLELVRDCIYGYQDSSLYIDVKNPSELMEVLTRQTGQLKFLLDFKDYLVDRKKYNLEGKSFQPEHLTEEFLTKDIHETLLQFFGFMKELTKGFKTYAGDLPEELFEEKTE
jgi:hypothetical protein